MTNAVVVIKGSDASGHYGHAGRPGLEGGSKPKFKPARFYKSDIGSDGKFAIEPPGMSIKTSTFLSEGLTDIYLKRGGVNEGYGPTADVGKWNSINAPAEGVKDDIVKNIVEDTGISYYDVNRTIKQWAHSSNDNDMRSLSLQEAAAEELGLELSDWQKERIANINAEKMVLAGNLRSTYMQNLADDLITTTQDDSMPKELAINNILSSTGGEIDLLGSERSHITELYDKIKAGQADGSINTRDQIKEIVYNSWYEPGTTKPSEFGKYVEAKIDYNMRTKNHRLFSLISRENERKIVRSMYDRTQKRLDELGFGPDPIGMYRGISSLIKTSNHAILKTGDIFDYGEAIGNAAEAWSGSRSAAGSFADRHLLFMRVPRKNIISSSRTGWGCLHEAEFIIAGSVKGSQAAVLSTSYFWDDPTKINPSDIILEP